MSMDGTLLDGPQLVTLLASVLKVQGFERPVLSKQFLFQKKAFSGNFATFVEVCITALEYWLSFSTPHTCGFDGFQPLTLQRDLLHLAQPPSHHWSQHCLSDE